MPLMRPSKTSKGERKDDTLKASKGGKYTRVGPVSPHVSDFYNTSNVNRHPTAIRRAEHVTSGRDRSARSLSVPSLHSTIDSRTKYSPPLSPPKPRSRSVRDPNSTAKKSHSFRRAIQQIFGSHSDLENGSGLWASERHQTEGTYRPLNPLRPKSMGESSDCSNSSALSRENSLRDSSRSRLKDGVFYHAARQPSTDSNEYPTEPRPISMPHLPRADMTRSNSSISLKNLHTKPGPPDTRYFSVAGTTPATSGYSDMIEGYSHRPPKPVRHLTRQGTSEDPESQWEDSSSFLFMNGPVLPSHPEYRQVAQDLMGISPSKPQTDPRRMSDASVDPRRVSNDSGVESLSLNKPNRSLPTTPIVPSFMMAGGQSAGTSSPEFRPSTPHTPHGYLSQESSHSTLSGHEYKRQRPEPHLPRWPTQEQEEDPVELPPGWELVKSLQYGTYYVNHNNKTAMYQHPRHALPPPPYHRPHHYPDDESRRRTPIRSHSHRGQSHRVLDSRDSLPRRSKSFRDQEVMEEGVSHERQLSTMTFVPPSPYQIKEIPPWVKEYVEKPFGSEAVIKLQSKWRLHSLEELTEVDTMVKRLFKKASEQVVRNCEYYRVAIQQEIDERARLQKLHSIQQKPFSPHVPSTFRYPSPPTEAHPPQEPHPHYDHIIHIPHTYEQSFVRRANSGGKGDLATFHPQNGTIKSRLSENQFHTLDETFV